MKRTKSQKAPTCTPRRRSGSVTRTATNEPPPLDTTSFPALLVQAAAARRFKAPERRVQHLMGLSGLPRCVARRCIAEPGFAPRHMLDAKYAYLISMAITRARMRATSSSRNRQRKLSKRISADETHRLMISEHLCAKIPTKRCIQLAFARLRFPERDVWR
jgi:hypothetical protein